jgi:ferritin-like metal-binding protein YciE
MATIAQPRDLFVNELKAMLYVEQKLADDVLPELAKEVSDSDFKESLREHTEETKRHVANVERIFELLGEEPKPDKSHAVDGLVAQHDKVAKNIEVPQLRDVFDAGAAAKTEYLEIAAYESLITTAEALGETEIVNLLEENLDEEKQALQQAKKAGEQLTQASATV